MTVADHELGVRIVSVEPTSLAYQANLRPEDIILQIDDTPVHSIDEFAVMSKALKGRAAQAQLLVLRNGQPMRVDLHLYSYALLEHWHVTFVPDYELRFVDPNAGRDYWANIARGFEEAGDAPQALSAWLNALHHVPEDVAIAVKVSKLFSTVARQRLAEHRLPEALDALQQDTHLLERLFEQPLDVGQLETVKRSLEETIRTIKTIHAQTS